MWIFRNVVSKCFCIYKRASLFFSLKENWKSHTLILWPTVITFISRLCKTGTCWKIWRLFFESYWMNEKKLIHISSKTRDLQKKILMRIKKVIQIKTLTLRRDLMCKGSDVKNGPKEHDVFLWKVPIYLFNINICLHEVLWSR